MESSCQNSEETGAPKHKSPFRHLWIVGLAVYLVVVWAVGWRKLGDAFAGLNPLLFGGVVVVEIANLWVRAAKWRYALGPGSRAVSMFFLSRCGGFWMPMRMGELSPLLFKRHRTPAMGAWIILDRILEISTTLALGVMGVVLLRISVEGIALAMAVVGCAFVVAPLFLLTRRGVFLWLAGRSKEGGVVHRASVFLAGVRDEIVLLRRKLPVAVGITIAAGCLDVVIGMLLYASFGFPASFALLATAKCVHALACAVPITPNATGVPFLTAGLLLNKAGGIPPHVIATAMGVYIALLNMVFWSVTGLVVFSLRRRGDDQASEDRSGAGPL